MSTHTDNETADKVFELAEKARVCMLVTGAEGQLRSRPMALQDIDDQRTLWFLVSRSSRCARDVGADPIVNLAFSDDSSWVSISGQARVDDDVARKHELWNPMVEAWFPGGKDDPDIVCMSVDADGAEYWDGPGGIIATAVSLVKSRLTGERLEADNQRVDL